MATTTGSPTRGRHILLAGLSLAIGLAVPLLVAEVTLRFLPVASGFWSLPVDSLNPILRFAPDRAFVFSRDWDLAMVNRGRINNAGFVNDQDYDSLAQTPLLAVVGDSYVEAAMLPWAETIQGRLAAMAGPGRRVYSFGVSGAPLSHYLAEAEFARDHYHPTALVVVVVGNDFDESLLRYKREPGLQYFAESGDSLLLRRLDYRPGQARALVRHSALARYLVFNLGVLSLPTRLRREAPAGGFVANTAATLDSTRLRLSRLAVDRFLLELPVRAGVPPSRVLLLVDGLRPHLYDPDQLAAAESSYAGVMRRYLIARATAADLEVVDLQARFVTRFAREGLRFEWPRDGHWNGLGHEEAAEAVAASRVYRSFLHPD